MENPGNTRTREEKTGRTTDDVTRRDTIADGRDAAAPYGARRTRSVSFYSPLTCLFLLPPVSQFCSLCLAHCLRSAACEAREKGVTASECDNLTSTMPGRFRGYRDTDDELGLYSRCRARTPVEDTRSRYRRHTPGDAKGVLRYRNNATRKPRSRADTRWPLAFQLRRRPRARCIVVATRCAPLSHGVPPSRDERVNVEKTDRARSARPKAHVERDGKRLTVKEKGDNCASQRETKIRQLLSVLFYLHYLARSIYCYRINGLVERSLI